MAQVNVPSGKLEEARAFYIGFLGMKEIARPAVFCEQGNLAERRFPSSCTSARKTMSNAKLALTWPMK